MLEMTAGKFAYGMIHRQTGIILTMEEFDRMMIEELGSRWGNMSEQEQSLFQGKHHFIRFHEKNGYRHRKKYEYQEYGGLKDQLKLRHTIKKLQQANFDTTETIELYNEMVDSYQRYHQSSKDLIKT